jgi:hypothetical protein
MTNEISFAELRSIAERSGLKLSEDELRRLLPGVNRSRTQGAELRDLMTDNLEPASAFSTQKA